ncbi:MAG: hypothetical protein ACI8RD_013612 [Bacillariaceae sp.]|jgi:hypothetical protein
MEKNTVTSSLLYFDTLLALNFTMNSRDTTQYNNKNKSRGREKIQFV